MFLSFCLSAVWLLCMALPAYAAPFRETAADVRPPTNYILTNPCVQSDRMPSFEDGDLLSFKRWVLKNLRFSEKIFSSGDEGSVDVKFSVNRKGKVRSVKTFESSGVDFASEVRRAVASSPRWAAGMSNGKSADCIFNLSFDVLLKRGSEGLYAEDNTVYTTADILPAFCGGDSLAFRRWVHDKVDSLSGLGVAIPGARIVVQLVVNRDGTLSDIDISGPDLDACDEFLTFFRLAIGRSPAWTPAELGGGKVRCRVSQTFKFEPELTSEDAIVPIESLEVQPRFQGGDYSVFGNWVMSRIRYPSEALERGIEGIVILTFIVGAQGEVSDMKVLQSPDSSLTAESLRVVGSSPRWTPGMVNGQPVRVQYSLPLYFRFR